LDIYPFVQWAEEEDLFTNYTYINKSALDFRTAKTANANLTEPHAIAHGIILPFDEDNNVKHHRSLSYINTDNVTHELYIGMFAHIDLMKVCQGFVLFYECVWIVYVFLCNVCAV
jgi:hypothetical protein